MCLERAKNLDLRCQRNVSRTNSFGGNGSGVEGSYASSTLELQPRVRIRLNLYAAHSELGQHTAGDAAARTQHCLGSRATLTCATPATYAA